MKCIGIILRLIVLKNELDMVRQAYNPLLGARNKRVMSSRLFWAAQKYKYYDSNDK